MKNILLAVIIAILFVGNLLMVIATKILKIVIQDTGINSSGITSLWIKMTNSLSIVFNEFFSAIFFLGNIYIFGVILLFLSFGFFYGLIVYFKLKSPLIYGIIVLFFLLLVLGGLAIGGPFFLTAHVTKNL